MELKDVLYGKRVYFDSSIFAYFLEGFNFKALTDLKEMIVKDEIDVFTCDQVFTEVVPLCILSGNYYLKDDIIAFIKTFNPSGTDFRKLREKGYKKFGKISSMRSLNVLGAIDNKCQVFLTDDPGIQVPEDMKLVLLSDYKDSLEQIPAI